jgi:putative phage-type endonuclease
MITREQWLAERRLGIGGSDVHHLFSEPPDGCRRQLAYDKLNIEPDYPQEVLPVMRRGNRLEDPAAEEYAEQTGRRVEKRGAITSVEHPFLRVNIDRVILDVADKPGDGVLEIKTMNHWALRKVRKEGLRAAHILQVQHGMAVTGFSWGAFAVLHPDSWEMLAFDVERDETLIAAIVREGRSFWAQVQEGELPEPLPEIDQRCKSCPWRRTCRSEEMIAAAKIPKSDSGIAVEQDDSLATLLADYREAKKMADESAETFELVKDALREKLGEREAVECEGSRIYYREQVAKRVDPAALRAKFPSVYDQVIKPSFSRPLRIYLV